MVYANLYKSQGVPVNAISYGDISATIYRHAYPRDAFQQLKEHGAVIEEKYPGVYYMSGMGPFPIQILVGRQLAPKEYAMFRVLTPGASDEDIRNFKDIALKVDDAAYLKSADNVFQVSISANEESYARLYKEDPEMCEAMRRLMKDDFIESEAKGARQQMEEDAKGMYAEGIKPDVIARIQKVSVDVVEKILGLQPV